VRGFAGAVTLVLVGIIVADLATHPEGVKAGGDALGNVLKSTYSAMLGVVPK
jgi:hypothetical protein